MHEIEIRSFTFVSQAIEARKRLKTQLDSAKARLDEILLMKSKLLTDNNTVTYLNLSKLQNISYLSFRVFHELYFVQYNFLF